MNKKGFTLIELLAVVTIIALLSMLIIPNIVGNVEKKKGEISDANMKLLASATDIYIENNRNKYANTFEASGSTYCIPVQVLINDNILETPFKDVNGEEIDYSKVMKSTYNDNYNSFDYQLVDVSECTEIVNHVNKPELYENMIPVVYKNNKWVKADINSKWYSYIDKNWANAVYVKEYKDDNIENSKSRFEYIDALPGTEIAESDILAQFVWIPRFKYQLFTNNEQTINIAFESVTTPKSNGIATNQWLTHPAFTSGNQELSGIWVAKYETSKTNNNVTVKKNKTPWTNIDYNSINEAIYNMSNVGNIYGITKNTHLIKNSEWSAVAYLTNSVYGINEKLETNDATTTGNTNSTTGNNTGIYDMSGLSKEFVHTLNETENDLGQALIETNNWYNDTNTFTTNEKNYLVRGNTSIFNYENAKINNENTSFRLSLSSNNSRFDYLKPYQITFDPNGGEVEQTTKKVVYNETYGELPIPTREGYTFMGWQVSNLLDYNDISSYAQFYGVQVDSDGYVSTSSKIDYRPWSYEESNWKAILEPGSYRLTIDFSNQCTNTTDGAMQIFSSTDEGIISTPYISNKDKVELNFSIIERTNIGILIKAYDGVYRIKLEKGATITDWEPYRIITSTSQVLNNESHVLTAKWQAD